MPTMSGMRRRGVTPEGLRDFVDDGGRLAQAAAHGARDARARDPERPQHARAARDVRRAIRSRWCSRTIPRGRSRSSTRRIIPHDVPKTGSRKVPFSRELYIERDDFMENPPKKFFRLAPGTGSAPALRLLRHVHRSREGRAGEIVELRCTYDPATRGGDSPDGRKVQGTIHWVSAPHALDVDASALRQALHGARTGCGRRPMSWIS